MCRIVWCGTRMIGLLLTVTFCCRAQAPQTLNIWPGVAPGSENWTQQEKVEKDTPIGTVIINVVTPAAR